MSGWLSTTTSSPVRVHCQTISDGSEVEPKTSLLATLALCLCLCLMGISAGTIRKLFGLRIHQYSRLKDGKEMVLSDLEI